MYFWPSAFIKVYNVCLCSQVTTSLQRQLVNASAITILEKVHYELHYKNDDPLIVVCYFGNVCPHISEGCAFNSLKLLIEFLRETGLTG